MKTTRRDTIRLAAAAAVASAPLVHVEAATSNGHAALVTTPATVTPVVPPRAPRPTYAPDLPVSADENYELTLTISYSLDVYPRKEDGPWRDTRAHYLVLAGRTDGAWRLSANRVLVTDDETGDDILGPALIAVRDQTAGPDPLAILGALLGAPPASDERHVITDLNAHELRALHLLSPELQAELIGLMQMDRHGEDTYGPWFGRWALTATDRELEGSWHSDPYYRDLIARVRAENLPEKAFAAWRSERCRCADD